ncbi:alpha/beta hydrolase family protein [Streptomyces sp. NPDC090054]|uniref:alpha/beta hydrolase family protein n=1 Tax=Streptomyces sp. NPDC090054 TaxID=3365933 RepID=UPI00380D12DC
MRRALLAVTAATLLMTGTARADSGQAATTGATTPQVAPALRAPTGGQPVGMTTVHLKDQGRADPWVPGERRELMVSVWYPAKKPSRVPAPYMTAEESRRYVESNRAVVPKEVPSEVLTTVVTHATVGAEPVTARGGLPLVVLSPGFGMPRATLTGLAEELASRGYVVAGIGHNHEAAGTTFPDGRTTSCTPCGNPDFPRVGAVRAQDVSFVLDELTGRHPKWKGGRLIDTGRIAMVGHSAGGFSAIPTMLGDPRIKAGVNMDGNFRFPNDVPLDRPFLMLGKPSHVPGGPDRTWDETWTELTGWKRWLTIDGTEHTSFGDMASIGKQLGIRLQPLDGDRCDTLLRAYVTAFADTHLQGRPAALLDGPSKNHPEVRFHDRPRADPGTGRP